MEEWAKRTHFGQIVVGPPGSGKTTYCKAMKHVLPALDKNPRKVCWINLDPANEFVSDLTSKSIPGSLEEKEVSPDIDICDLVNLEDIMEATHLGPNGGLLHAMDIILENISWLSDQLIDSYSNHYLIFDIPGQVELCTIAHTALKKIIEILTGKFLTGASPSPDKSGP